MLISTKGRYALRVLIDLVQHQTENGYVPLKEIASRQGISEKYLENIVKTLVRSEMLVGVRGKNGGYRLTKDPSEYTAASILRLTEGSLAPVACLEREPVDCERAATCKTLAMWKGLYDTTERYLEGITLADLANAEPGCPLLVDGTQQDAPGAQPEA